jgi:hypothetical protein
LLGEDAAGVRGIGNVCYILWPLHVWLDVNPGRIRFDEAIENGRSVTDKRNWRCGGFDWAAEEYSRSR